VIENMVARAGVAQHYTDFSIPLRLELNPGKLKTRTRPALPTGVSVSCRFPTNGKEQGIITAPTSIESTHVMSALTGEDAKLERNTPEHGNGADRNHGVTIEARKEPKPAAESEPLEAIEETAAASSSDRSAAAQPHSWWRFKFPICQFLDQSPMTFKELCIAIARRHPKHCPGFANGKVVSFSRIKWLHEVERDLHKVAVHSSGVWHLKESVRKEMPPHGTITRYKRYGCSCDKCTTNYSRLRGEKFKRTGN
jgi:hypothetical protein